MRNSVGKRNDLATVLLSVTALLALAASVPAPRAGAHQAAAGRSAAPAASTARIGKVTLSYPKPGTLTYVQGASNSKTSVFDLRGPRVSVTSARYDLAAPRIQVTAKNQQVSQADATGGVRVMVRNPEAGQATTVTCSSATYAAGTGAGRADRIDLKGNVRSVTRDPNLAEPLVNEAESGYIELLPNGRTRVVLSNGIATATPLEPASRKSPRP